MNKVKFLALSLVLTLCLAGVVYAGTSVGYDYLKSAPAVVKNAVTAGDATTWAAPLNPVPTYGNPTSLCSASFGTASATVDVFCGLYFKNADGTYTFLGMSSGKVTITGAAAGTTESGGLFPGLAPAAFDTRGAPYVDIRIAAPSAGTVTTRQWCYGLKSS